jgi:hypothetical protein
MSVVCLIRHLWCHVGDCWPPYCSRCLKVGR